MVKPSSGSPSSSRYSIVLDLRYGTPVQILTQKALVAGARAEALEKGAEKAEKAVDDGAAAAKKAAEDAAVQQRTAVAGLVL